MELGYISNKLTHWTGRGKSEEEAFKTLLTILKTKKLILSQCYTGPSSDIHPKSDYAEKIACFTDIPLTLSKEHCNIFGNIGISFKKENMIRYGAHPVVYYLESMIDSIRTYADYVFHKFNEIQKISSTNNIEHVNISEYENLRRLLSIVQTYDYFGDGKSENPNYYQREWRVFFDGSRVSEDFDNPKPGEQTLDVVSNRQYFNFDYNDVESIIVPHNFKSDGLELIQGMGNINLYIYEELV